MREKPVSDERARGAGQKGSEEGEGPVRISRSARSRRIHWRRGRKEGNGRELKGREDEGMNDVAEVALECGACLLLWFRFFSPH